MENVPSEYIDITEEIEDSGDSQEDIKEIEIKDQTKKEVIKKNNKKGVKIHSISSKLKIIKFAEKNGRVRACDEYNIPESTLRGWIKNKVNFENLPSEKLSLTTLHKGGNVKYPDVNNKLIDYIEFNRKLGFAVTTWSLLLELYKYIPERKEYKIKSNLELLYRFMYRNGYSFRKGTHIGQGIKEESLKEASLFWNEVHKCIKEEGFTKYNIFNMDETPLFFNMVPNTTIAKRGKKSIIIKTQNQQKCRISVLLCIAADGSKLPPLIILKGKSGGIIEKNISKNNLVITKKCYVCVNDNAWSTDSIIKHWFYNVWLRYIKIEENLCENAGYLILDKASSHLTNNVLEMFKNNNQFISFIPAGLTRFIQPLDVVINKPFKDALRKKYIEHCAEGSDFTIKISRDTMIQFICDVWYDPNIITEEMITKSFMCTGIIYSQNQDENIFTAWKNMKNEMSFIQDDLGEDFGEDEETGIKEDMDIESD